LKGERVDKIYCRNLKSTYLDLGQKELLFLLIIPDIYNIREYGIMNWILLYNSLIVNKICSNGHFGLWRLPFCIGRRIKGLVILIQYNNDDLIVNRIFKIISSNKISIYDN
jgi:hypothetical protein